jgi:hypothetical protein
VSQSLVYKLSESECVAFANSPGSIEHHVSIGLFVSELRVVALGSAYPISYDAITCPFTGATQPSIDLHDRDADGISDSWEQKYGLDPYLARDALADSDEDGFSNLDEFVGQTHPFIQGSHPPYALKYRFYRMIETPFPFIFQGVSQPIKGCMVFQLNGVIDGRTYFGELNEMIEGIVIQGFIPRSNTNDYTLIVRRGDLEMKLPRGKKIIDPESRVEVINLLDHTTEVATMGALLSLRSDVYTVVGVSRERIEIRQHESGEVFEVIRSAEGEHKWSAEDLKNRVN